MFLALVSYSNDSHSLYLTLSFSPLYGVCVVSMGDGGRRPVTTHRRLSRHETAAAAHFHNDSLYTAERLGSPGRPLNFHCIHRMSVFLRWCQPWPWCSQNVSLISDTREAI